VIVERRSADQFVHVMSRNCCNQSLAAVADRLPRL